MAGRTAPLAPPRERRSQAERTAETRARIVAAVVASIDEVGFQRTTATEIALRAGVTWGAVQHHFGGKDGILVAALEESFRDFAARVEDIPLEEPLEKRVSLFVERAWMHFGSDRYRSTFEILLDSVGREDGPEPSTWRDEMFHAWRDVWRRLFGDAPVDARRHRMLQHYTISVLSGLAATLRLEGRDAAPRPGELDLLVHTLRRELDTSLD